MGVFKLDLMTLLVIFVVLSVVFTMFSGSKDNDQNNAVQSTPRAPIEMGSVNKVSTGGHSSSMFRSAPVVVSESKFSGKPWN